MIRFLNDLGDALWMTLRFFWPIYTAFVFGVLAVAARAVYESFRSASPAEPDRGPGRVPRPDAHPPV